MAASEDHVDIVEFLIANGADVEARDNEGKLPLDWVASFSTNQKEMKHLLAGKGSPQKRHSPPRRPALETASSEEKREASSAIVARRMLDLRSSERVLIQVTENLLEKTDNLVSGVSSPPSNCAPTFGGQMRRHWDCRGWRPNCASASSPISARSRPYTKTSSHSSTTTRKTLPLSQPSSPPGVCPSLPMPFIRSVSPRRARPPFSPALQLCVRGGQDGDTGAEANRGESGQGVPR